MKNTIIGLILGLIIAMWAFYIYTQKPVSKDETPPIVPTSTIDTLSPSVNEISAEESIKQAFAKKYNRKVSDVHLTISQKDSTHVWGSVKFGDELAGGWFLAYKESSNGWIIVADGNGTISCETIAPYNFPISMVSECVDKNGKLQKL